MPLCSYILIAVDTKSFQMPSRQYLFENTDTEYYEGQRKKCLLCLHQLETKFTAIEALIERLILPNPERNQPLKKTKPKMAQPKKTRTGGR
jgi:hypothetical protein